MSRYRGPRLRIIRRLGELPGFTSKTTTRTSSPGQHGGSNFAKSSAYGIRLQEKQKLRFNYGITERQLLSYVKKAKRMKGSTGEVLLQLLEMRLDNVVFRLGMAPTVVAARQLISHGHIVVNDQKVTIPSYACQVKDVISVRAKNNSRKMVTEANSTATANVPSHLSWNKESLVGVVNKVIDRKDVGLQLNELLVVEYYSR
uniref:Small ribosomal subunit protein uS4c n=1 Tax=Oltmannsiellopsis viridis TaxID=51324 RepID=RR4_OLTVI|nr:ribosomal protein S4 [Oltmannsiellopsis viridis]Q20EX0.1 RecName: Full=Small ribosomal subunit protein uS4c; AltName: Full=30S ribosomal protein S4, chloroplastic [Oltmannsiellopsis viridis]ABB81943.1 ribosomal protein S4 [Oltmannsiellopsis viridis]